MDISFRIMEPSFEVNGYLFRFHLFTTENIYYLDETKTAIEKTDEGFVIRCSGLTWAGGQRQAEGSATIAFTLHGDTVSWTIEATHAHKLKSVKTLIEGIKADELFHPGMQLPKNQGSTLPISINKPKTYNYPSRQLFTPLMFLKNGETFTYIQSLHRKVTPKRFYLHKKSDSSLLVEAIFEEDAKQWSTILHAPEWRLGTGTDPLPVVQSYGDHLKQAFGLEEWDSRPDKQAWLNDIELVVNLHGEHCTGYVFNTFDEMLAVLENICGHIPGKHVLAYLPGWDGRYYFNYPKYEVSDALGGEDGLRRLISGARELGVRVMPMFGVHGVNTDFYSDWRTAEHRHGLNVWQQLVNEVDWDSDRSGDGWAHFMNPGEANFRRALIDRIKVIVRTYNVEVIFLDTIFWWVNDGRYDAIEGYKAIKTELLEEFPHLLIAGESWYDGLLGVLPFIQLNMVSHNVQHHPELFLRFSRSFGHLCTPCPGDGSTGVYEEGFDTFTYPTFMKGHVPALGIAKDTIRHVEEIGEVCRLAREYAVNNKQILS